MFGGIGPQEILLIFLVVLLLFGAKRIPEIGSAMGKGIREFKSSVREIEGELKATPEKRDQIPAASPQATPAATPQAQPAVEAQPVDGSATPPSGGAEG